MSAAAFGLFLLLYAAAVAWGVSRRNEIELLPSIGWLLAMLLPFWVQFDSFPEPARTLQGFAIAWVAGCLLVGDIILPRIAAAGHAPRTAALDGRLADYRLYAVFLVVVALYHLSLLEHIPLLEKYVHRVEDSRELSWMREQTSKLLAVHTLMKYVFTWAVNIAAPLAIVLAWNARRRVWALALLAFAVIYAAMSLAKVPLFLLAIALVVVCAQRVAFRKRLTAYAAGLLLLIPLAWDAYSFFSTHPYNVFRYKASPETIAALKLAHGDPRAHLTIGDHARLMPLDADRRLQARERVYNYYVYRAFLSPVDVSSRWYQFFPAVLGHYIGLQGLTPADRERSAQTHPARLVGAWAYAARFPDKYLETAQAYASVDADAYARYGIAGVAVVGVLLLLLRLALKALRIDSALGQTLYALGVTLVALLWPMASLQAVLVANGLGVILILMLLARLQSRWRSRHAPAGVTEPTGHGVGS